MQQERTSQVGAMTENAELFTIRLWEEVLNEDQQSEWRGKIHHINSGEVRYFRDWSKMMAFIGNRLPNSAAKGARIASVRQPAGHIRRRRWQRKRTYPHRSSRCEATIELDRSETGSETGSKTLKVSGRSHPRVKGRVLRDLSWLKLNLEILRNDKLSLIKNLVLIFAGGAIAIVGWNLISTIYPNIPSMVATTKPLLVGATVVARHELQSSGSGSKPLD